MAFFFLLFAGILLSQEYLKGLFCRPTEVFVGLDIVFKDRITTNGACYRRPISPEMMITLCTVEDPGHSAGGMSTAHEKYLGPG